MTGSVMDVESLAGGLGIRPEIRGLLVDLRIPSEWESHRVTRRFRRAIYEILVENPDHVCQGVREIYVTASGTTPTCCRYSPRRDARDQGRARRAARASNLHRS